MISQRTIENAAGIDEAVAAYIMKQETCAARTAMDCLALCVRRFEYGAFGILKAAVDECRREMAQVAQSVEHVVEDHGVGGSTPSLGTT